VCERRVVCVGREGGVRREGREGGVRNSSGRGAMYRRSGAFSKPLRGSENRTHVHNSTNEA